jgi:hypothetical protein
MKLTDRELATVLAALRHFQNTVRDDPTDVYPDHFAAVDPLDFDGDGPDTIDGLCERLNAPDDSPECVRDLIALAPADRRYVRDLLMVENDLDEESRHLGADLPEGLIEVFE